MKRRKERGQALAEFALTLPILMLFLLGILDFGRVFFAYAQVSNNLRQALRQAANVGYASKTYLDCGKMIDIVDNTNIAVDDIVVEVTYHLENDTIQEPCDTTGDIVDDDVVNGDFIEINVTANIRVWVLPIAEVPLNFTGQRTIVKNLDIGALANDNDNDGLDDNWEILWFTTNNVVTGLGDYDCDGVLNGAEEEDNTDPKNPDMC